jgi:hypothetical protein
MSKPDRLIRIGGASGFWGDSDYGPKHLIKLGKVDYLVFDYLAELTMSILASARARSPDLGYATDFVNSAMAAILRDVVEQGVKVISNAGGLNPRACAAALQALAEREGVDIKVAYVEGDDIFDRTPEFRAGGVKDMGSGRPLPDTLLSANAYLGARPVAAALAQGAQVVITGRAVDSALALGALVHEFGWSFDDYDKIATGSLVGHLLECGAQATGGLHTDWESVPGWENIGYPIAECRADGRFWMTKPEGTGGLVNHAVIGEQMLYEIGDPGAYALPDVMCDFTEVELEDVGPDRVEVRNTKGRAPSGQYKVSGTYSDGYRVTVQVTIVGIDAVAKAERTASSLLARVRAALREKNLGDFTETLTEVIGGESIYGPHSRARGAREVQMRLSARHPEKAALTLLARELAQAGTSWSPGTTGAGKRVEPSQVVRLFSFLWPTSDVKTNVVIDGASTEVAPPVGGADVRGAEPQIAAGAAPGGDTVEVPLIRLAWARSGDKGDISNIGVIARSPEALEVIRRELTPEKVKAYMSHLVKGNVRRFDLPGIGAFNFVMEQALAGGGMASLRNDPLGKGMGQILLDIPINAPRSLVEPSA